MAVQWWKYNFCRKKPYRANFHFQRDASIDSLRCWLNSLSSAPPDIFTAAVWNMKGRRVFVLKKVNADPSGCGPLGRSINKVLWGETFPQDPTRYSLKFNRFYFQLYKGFYLRVWMTDPSPLSEVMDPPMLQWLQCDYDYACAPCWNKVPFIHSSFKSTTIFHWSVRQNVQNSRETTSGRRVASLHRTASLLSLL